MNPSLELPSKRERGGPSPYVPGLLLVLLIVYAGPLFLRMPLTNDAHMYDVQARLVENGGVLYRDILEPNLPGVVWLHYAVRSVGGDSSEALRLFDLLVVLGVAFLVGRYFSFAGWSRSARIWLGIGVVFFYVSQSEWCHCQRDAWLLLPVWGALTVRQCLIRSQQSETATDGTVFRWAYLEGVIWGAGVWIKPHVIVPAALVFAVSTISTRPGKRFVPDLAGLLLGGGIVGVLGGGWMIFTGCWEPFWDVVQNWNPSYVASARENRSWSRFLATSLRLSPWFLLHASALLIALRSLVKLLSERSFDSQERNTAILAACYLGWTLQVAFMQHLFDYVYAPTVLLATLLTVSALSKSWSTNWCRALAAGFVLLAVWKSPFSEIERARLWPRCLTEKATPALYAKLAVLKNPVWDDMGKIAEYLENQDVTGRDVCFFQGDLMALYNELDLMPPTRYGYLYELTVYIPEKRKEILQTARNAEHRFIVTDTLTGRIAEEDLEKLLSESYQAKLWKPRGGRRNYPWGHPVVFRAGPYLVHQVVRESPVETSPSSVAEVARSVP